MRFDIITIFPEYFKGPFGASIIGRAVEKKLIEVNFVNPRNFALDKRRSVDDAPYGGGPGMLMKAEPIFRAVESVKSESSKTVLLSASGRLFTQNDARMLSGERKLILICGHYEGVDERVAQGLADFEFSIGDYVLPNGNAAAIVMLEAISRLIPGALGSEESAKEESFISDLLEYPQWTRPENLRGMKAPDILLSGNHAAIAKWRKEQAKIKTRKNRPDLLKKNEEQKKRR